MEPTTLLGIAAGTLTTAAYLPQALKTWQSKSAGDMSWSMLIALSVGIVLWLVYGTYEGDVPLVLANLVTLIFTATILGMKIVYRRA